jgi:osmotically-inducible protein OsmY
VRDARLIIEARRVLHQDPELARCNLAVSINQGVAVVWGRVPSEALARRALDQVRQVRGIFEVHHELLIQPFEFGLDRKEKKSPDPGRPKKEPLPSGRLVGLPGSKPPSSVTPRSAELPPLSAAVSLLPPVSVTVPNPSTSSGPSAVLLPPAPSASAVSLESAVEQLRRGDRRFQQVRAEVRLRTVHLSGPTARVQDIRDLADQVARIPEVASVVIEHQRASPK